MRALSLLAWAPLALIVATILGALAALALHLPLATLTAALADPETHFALALSLRTSLAALLIALALGVPSAYLLARRRFPGKAVVETILDLPMVTPPLVAGIGLLFLLGRDGPIPALGREMLFAPAGVVLAQAYVATSVLTRSARAAFGAIDPGFAANAGTLGLPPFWAFLLVEVPMAGRALLSAAILGWARALGEFGATLMVAGATRFHTETLPMAIFLNIASGRTDVAIACALVLLALAFALLLAIRLLAGERADPMTEAPDARLAA